MSPRKIIHVDMDAFFASVEQRDDPALRGRPVAVGSATGRGVVAAASYEARKFGVRSAMPSVTALRRCPGLVFVPHRFDVYRAVSRQIRAIFEDYTPLVEPLSLDEAYLDVTANLRALPSATATASEIRARIREETRLTASAGISYNKFLAKIASDQNKPDGQFVITPATGPAFVADLPVARFHGVGPRTTEKMHRLGIHTGADLRARDLAFLKAHFGKAGAWYHAIARGEDDREVTPDRPRKSASSEMTVDVDLATPEAVEAALLGQAELAVGVVREERRARAHGDGQGALRRFPDRHAEPHAGRAGGRPRHAARGFGGIGADVVPAARGHPADRRDAFGVRRQRRRGDAAGSYRVARTPHFPSARDALAWTETPRRGSR